MVPNIPNMPYVTSLANSINRYRFGMLLTMAISAFISLSWAAGTHFFGWPKAPVALTVFNWVIVSVWFAIPLASALIDYAAFSIIAALGEFGAAIVTKAEEEGADLSELVPQKYVSSNVVSLLSRLSKGQTPETPDTDGAA